VKLGFLYSVPLLGVILFVFSVAFPPFDDLTTLNLSVHMLEHIMIMISGWLVAYPLFKAGWFDRVPKRAATTVSVAAVCAILFFWHLPFAWDSAVLDPLVHAVEHGFFFLAGFLIGAFFPMLTNSSKSHVLMLGFAAHILYGLALILQYQIYPLYDVVNQLWLGIWVFMPTPLYLYGIVVYGILSNRGFAADLNVQFGINVDRIRSRASGIGSSTRRFIPVLSISMLLVLGGWFGAAALSIGTTPYTPVQHASTVYIVESPLTWNYSPQNITVVIGVNNTVTWVSRSISFDTITSDTGLFDSGNIAPGKTYSYTFEAPGVYGYDCVYHPWMVGTVTVLAA
jgi:plastocyanin